ncbi:hypothetical protein HHX47_DHR7000347 [Lentinula edodes]|nr:hypothetical protein HHX47_DHR7000347 [Lentinula edodes]
MTRRDALFATLHSNLKAPFVTRVVQFGSEPLYDGVLSPQDLADQVWDAKAQLDDLGIPIPEQTSIATAIVTKYVLVLCFAEILTGKYRLKENDGAPEVIQAIDFNGWPSKNYSGVEPNSPYAVANVQNEHDYYTLLDSKCTYFKTVPGGGVGWFAHIYSDNMEPGYGIYGTNGRLKFPFAPRTSC